MFKLNTEFVRAYMNTPVNFGYSGLGELVYKRTYSRNEEWYQTIERVVNGTYQIQQKHILDSGLEWLEDKAQKSAQEMYDRIFNMKFLPPGRGLWSMGTRSVTEKHLYASLNNCGFVSTINIHRELAKPFIFTMDMLMLGVGVGSDVLGAGQILIHKPDIDSVYTHFIPDSREGWVESVGILLNSYFIGNRSKIIFDYSNIRVAGEAIKTFGGISCGCEPLKELHSTITETLNKNIGLYITITTIADVMNAIGKCVVSGNIRRGSEVILGHINDEFINLKNYEINKYRQSFGWVSNNSIIANVGDDCSRVIDNIKSNGEPGIFWLDNARKYSRMNNIVDNKDSKVMGANPCMEQSLESYELCCLVETFPEKCDNYLDFLRTLKFAYLYAKTITLCKTHWKETNIVQLKNRRIGCSVSGIAQYLAKYTLNDLKMWLSSGYDTINYWDNIYSDWFTVPKSIKKTSVKPSGTVSLLAGATPGIHFPFAKYYIRRVRLNANDPLLNELQNKGYHIEGDINAPDSMKVVSFPIKLDDNVTTIDNVSIWQQYQLVAFLQEHWSDNQVSCTINFKKHEENEIAEIVKYAQYRLKCISFLPMCEEGAYQQMPYEKITESQYYEMREYISDNSSFANINYVPVGECFCDGDNCQVI
jgi:ribonucleoside-triphosphate reductase (thioredoxin)